MLKKKPKKKHENGTVVHFSLEKTTSDQADTA